MITAAVLALCLLGPASATAAEEDEGAIHAFRLKASNGYRVLVLASRQPGKAHGQMVMIVASKRAGFAMYATSATVEEAGIHAELGALGRIDLEYSSLKGKEKHSCGPGDEVSQVSRGVYTGLFELHGEEGYTEAQATRIRGGEGVVLDLICPGHVTFSDATGPGEPGARLSAILRRGKDSAVAFEIKNNRPAAAAAFKVSARERRGGLWIKRGNEGAVGGGGFHYDPRLRVATVSPAAPFDGSATFRRGAEPGKRWTGDLTVDLPGRADTPLTGAGFHLRLVHASWSKSGDDAGRSAFGRPLALLEAP